MAWIMRFALAVLLALAVAAAAVWFSRAPHEPSAPTTAASAGDSAGPGATRSTAAPPQSAPLTELSGVVVDDRASPVAGAVVTAARSPETLAAVGSCVHWAAPAIIRARCSCGLNAQHVADAIAQPAAGVELARATTDASGRFHLAGVAPGDGVYVTARSGETLAIAAAAPSVRLELRPMLMLEGDVKDEAGKAVANATVAVLDGAPARTLTDGAGHFTLSVLPGQVRVAASAPGRVADLRAVDTETSLSFVLPRPLTVHGRVVQHDTPIAGAKVRQSFAPCEAETTTAADGSFELTGMRPQQLRLDATSGSRVGRLDVPAPSPTATHVIELVDGVLVQGHVFGDDGEAIPGARVELSLPLPSVERSSATAEAGGHFKAGPVRPGTWTVTVEAPGYLRSTQKQELSAPGAQIEVQLKKGQGVTGRVVDASGAPVERAWVHNKTSGFGVRPEQASTTADGRFQLVNLGPGEHELEVTGGDFAPARVTVTSPADLTITLVAGAFISGRVLDHAGVKLAIPVPPKDPMQRAQAAIAMMGRTPSAKNGVQLDVHTGDGEQPAWADGQPDGTFRAGPLAAGEYEICANLGTRHGCGTTTVAAGARASLDITLPDALSISGVVKDTSGRLIAQAQVTLIDAGGGVRLHEGAEVTADAAGAFRMDDVEEGDHMLMARAKGLTQHTPVPVIAGATGVVITLEPGQYITGRVIGDNGPLTTARVGTGTVDADGRFELERGLESFVIYAEGYAPLKQSVDTSKPGSVDVGDVRMSRGVNISGVVTDVAQAPVEGAFVSCGSASGSTDKAGRFTCEHVMSGKHDLRVHLTGWVATRTTVEAPASDVHLTLGHGQRVTGRVVDDEGKPIAGARVMASNAAGAIVRTESGADGAFELSGVSAGPGRVGAIDDERTHFAPVDIEIAEGHDANVVLKGRVHGSRLRLKEAGALIGRLFEPGVDEKHDFEDGRPESLERNGDAIWPALPAGHYTLEVMTYGIEQALVFDVDSTGSGEIVIELDADDRKTLGLPPRG
jgi:hypothetical protein